MSDNTQVWFGYTEDRRNNPVPVLYWSDPDKNDLGQKPVFLLRPFMIELPKGYDPVGLLKRLADENPPPPKYAKAVEAHNADTISKLQTGETRMPGPDVLQRLQIKLEQAIQIITKLHNGAYLTDEELDKVASYLGDRNKYADAFMVQFEEGDDGIPES